MHLEDGKPQAEFLDTTMAVQGEPELVKNDNGVRGKASTTDKNDIRQIWRDHRKHILIFSSAGKPIFSRYGDESSLSAMFGLLQGKIISHYITIYI